jgi:ubiquitin-like domain-containing CTD phosphatase 1
MKRFHVHVHVDDLARNFAMNPRNGIRVEPFMNAPVTRHTDRELFVLSKYLTLIAKLESFDGLDHSAWREYVAKNSAD